MRKVTPTAPAYGSASATGVSTTPNASRPQGMPPSGQPLRHTSIVVQAAANHSGQSRCRWTSADSDPQARRTASPASPASARPIPTARIQKMWVK